MIKISQEILSKFTDFTKKAISELSYFETQNKILAQKRAELEYAQQQYGTLVEKLAEMYSGMDLLLTSRDREVFIKKASQNPIFLLNAIHASHNRHRGSFGKVASVRSPFAYDDDPVAKEAFGNNSAGYLMIDDND